MEQTITVIIPVKPGGEVAALEALRMSAFPPERIEVIVAEGRAPSRQRNEAARCAGGDILYFLDDDSRVTPEVLSEALPHFADPQVAAVGGPSITPAADTPLQRAFGRIFSSLLGGGGVRNRYRCSGTARRTDDSELILCNLAFRRDIFLAAAGLDERLFPNEENELMDRLTAEGWRLIHDPHLAVVRSQRTTLAAFCRQLYSYGRGRGEQTLLARRLRPVSLVPSLFVLYLLALPFLPGGAALPAAAYAAAVAGTTISVAFRDGIRVAAWLPLAFPLFHLCYGVGMLRVFLLGRLIHKPPGQVEVTLRRVKEFATPWQ